MKQNKVKHMRSIVFVNRVLPPQHGASGRILHELAEAFAKDGWCVSIICTGDKTLKTKLPKKIAQKLRIYRTGSNHKKRKSSYMWASILLLLKLLRLRRHDIIVTLSDPPLFFLAGRFAAFIKGSHHVHWCQDLYPDLFPYVGVKLPGFIQKGLKRLSRKTLKKTSKVIVPGRCMARKLTHTGVEPTKISVIPNWYDTVLVKDSPAQKSLRRPNEKDKPLFVDDRPKFRILYAGSLSSLHVKKAIVEAAAKLEAKYDDIEVVCVGDSKGHEGMARLRAEKHASNMRFLPYQPIERLQDVMEGGDVHLVSLRDEIEGLCVPSKFYASLAAQRPCIFIGPEGSEIAKIIKDFECGEVVSPDNVNALVLAISAMRDDQDVWFSAQKGAIKASRQLTPEQSWSAWIKRMDEVVDQV